MSTQLIARSPDLSRLRDEGYEIDVRHDHVIVTNVPYVTPDRAVARGTLVIALTTAGDRTGPPPDHTAYWSGEVPCHLDGTPIERIQAGAERRQLVPDLAADHRFSSKPQPAGKYEDYYHQFIAYVRILEHEAQALDPDATAATFAPVATTEEESVFLYRDTASSRAGITMASLRLALEKVAIVGLGGTGSYVLDLVAKTPVGEIHLYDADELLNHNAFRAPGATSLEELRERPAKVEHFAALYGRMRRNVIPHKQRVHEDNVEDLAGMAFVFLCMDSGPDKRAIVKYLEATEVPFIDVGMGLDENGGSIGGLLRVTTSTPEKRNHVWEHDRITFEDPDDDANEYARNIQVADLNALNACLAVVRWKRWCGFYRDLEHEHFALYAIDGNHLLNEDQT